MAGGQGTRLRPLTYAIPKSLLPVGKKPILEIIIEGLKAAGFGEVILTVGYKADLIRTYFRDGHYHGICIKYLEEREHLGTAGSLRLLLDELKEPFLSMNGDLLTKLDYGKMYRAHLDSSSELTVACRDYVVQLPYGMVHVSKRGEITGMTEKPDLHHTINAGIYVMSPSALDVIPPGIPFDMPDAVNALIKQRRSVQLYPITDYWRDIGQMKDYEEVNSEAENWSR